MVHVRTSHPIRLWTGNQTPEQPNDRLVKLTWKTDKDTGIHHSARCFSAPIWQPELEGKDAAYIAILVDAMEAMQKKAAHTYVTEQLKLNLGVCYDIPHYIIAPETLLEEFNYSEASDDSSRGKLSADQIKAWYADKLDPLVTERLATAQGWDKEGFELTEEHLKKLEQASNGYRATLERLAAPSPKVNIDTAKALKSALALLPDNIRKRDIVAIKLDTKLDNIINPPADKITTLAML